MDTEDFIKNLSKAEELIKEEKYKKSLNLLSELREIELKGDFDNNLTHKLYQLISNAESLLNQEKITEGLSGLSEKHQKMDFKSLSDYFKKHKDLDLKPEIIRREIELLILRGKISHTIKKGSLVFH